VKIRVLAQDAIEYFPALPPHSRVAAARATPMLLCCAKLDDAGADLASPTARATRRFRAAISSAKTKSVCGSGQQHLGARTSHFLAAPFEFRRGPFWNIRFGRAAICGGKDVMAHFVFGTVVIAALSVPFVAMSYNEASAQERATCSQARSHCGTQRVCQRRYEACMETGCWKVTLVRRCGYEKR
jgi:hypothetical protein